jgi:GNAT superfamily N-acetyltransferase
MPAMDITVARAVTDAQILACFEVMCELRPGLARDSFVATVRRMEPGGFRLAFVAVDGTVQAVAGYRIIEMLRTGRMLEIDDLVTASSARSSGFGERLFHWLVDEARGAGCSVVELDSGVQRADAHRFYFRQRMHVLGFHFSVPISPVGGDAAPG